jgi:hypothetical protein
MWKHIQDRRLRRRLRDEFVPHFAAGQQACSMATAA